MLQATSGIYDVILRILNEYLHRVSSLRPPEHLSGLHGNFIATYEETVRTAEELVETAKSADTEIKSREDLDDFLNLEFSLEVPEELEAQSEKACLELKEQLETGLGREVSICDSDGAAGGPAAPGATAEPAVRSNGWNRRLQAASGSAGGTGAGGASSHPPERAPPFQQPITSVSTELFTAVSAGAVPHLRGKDRRLRRMLGPTMKIDTGDVVGQAIPPGGEFSSVSAGGLPHLRHQEPTAPWPAGDPTRIPMATTVGQATPPSGENSPRLVPVSPSHLRDKSETARSSLLGFQ